MTENLRLKRIIWAATAASLAGDDRGVHTLLRDLGQRDLFHIAAAAIDMATQLIADGRDREALLTGFRDVLAETALADQADEQP